MEQISKPEPKILVIEVGGSSVKVLVTGKNEVRKRASGSQMTAEDMVDAVREMTKDWDYDVVSIGYPGVVRSNRPVREPVNLGKGWVDFDYEGALQRPVRIVNDAAMQALGSYEGGRMLFLGLGTGLGSALVIDGSLVPMELGHLPYRRGRTYEQYLGKRGLERRGRRKWRKSVCDVISRLRDALQTDYVIVGGGNAKKLGELPPGVRPGANANAFVGGFRLWTDRSALESLGVDPVDAGQA